MALIIPNSIDNDTPADAAELQQNFSTIQSYINTNVLHRDGSVALTSPILLPGDPTQPNQAANKGYVDGRDALYVPLAGGTVTGQIKGITPTAAEDLACKDYVDTKLPLTGGTVTGQISGITPVAAEDLARKDYVDAQVATQLSQTEGDARYVNLVGDTVSGDIFWVRSPSNGGGVYIAGEGAVGAIGASVTSAHGSTTSTDNLVLGRGGAAAGTGATFISLRANAASSGAPWLTQIGSISQASATAVAFNTTSDPRTKTPPSMTRRTASTAAERVRQLGNLGWVGQHLNPETGEPDPVDWDFLSSHDIEDVAPYAVHGERDAVDGDGNPIYQQVDYPSLVPLLFAALADALDRINLLETAHG